MDTQEIDNYDDKLIALADKTLFRVYDGKTLLMVPSHGTLTSHDLRVLADEMDKRS